MLYVYFYTGIIHSFSAVNIGDNKGVFTFRVPDLFKSKMANSKLWKEQQKCSRLVGGANNDLDEIQRHNLSLA